MLSRRRDLRRVHARAPRTRPPAHEEGEARQRGWTPGRRLLAVAGDECRTCTLDAPGRGLRSRTGSASVAIRRRVPRAGGSVAELVRATPPDPAPPAVPRLGHVSA